MRISSQKRARSSGGIAVLLTSVMVVGAMMAVGLAVDVGMMYAVKTKLSAAADAAALAASRALGRAGSGGPSGQAAATTYFNANMPQGYMLATNISVTPTGPVANGSVQTMKVDAQADLPLLFSRFLQSTQTIKVTATASRQDVNLMMVLDRSGSMNTSNSCAPMVAAAQDFTKQFVDGRDQLGLIVFGGSWHNSYPPSLTFKSGSTPINTVIGTITCGGNTGSAQAIWQAYQSLKALPGAAGALNVIVFFTDGQPNGLSADWPIATLSTAGFSYANSSGNASCGSFTGCGSGTAATPVSPWFLGYAKSGCSATSITGVIARNSEQNTGIYGMTAASIGSDAGAVSGSGCAFSSGTQDAHQQSGQARAHEDVAYIPTTDTYGNKTSGYWDTAAGTHLQSISVGPYAGKTMLDHYATGTCGSNPCGLFDNNIDLKSMNAAEDAAYRARSDSSLRVMVMAIGLGGAADAFPGQFLEHVANTVSSDLHSAHTTEPTGNYVYVNGPGELGGAFQQIASYVQRLTQ